MLHTLLIWEEIPEEIHLFAIPRSLLEEHPDWNELLQQAHGHYVNRIGDDGIEGLNFLNAALLDSKHKDNPTYHDKSMKPEWLSVFHKFKIQQGENPSPIEGYTFNQVIRSGFFL